MATTTVRFATNRALLAAGPGGIAAFGPGHAAPSPHLYRVGEVPVRRIGAPWALAGEAHRAGRPRLVPESAPGRGRPGGAPGSPGLFARMAAAMRAEGRDGLVFLHGFAASFASAAERAAALAEAYLAGGTPHAPETARAPLAFAFAWPADDSLVLAEDRWGWAYAGDREDARASGVAMARAGLRLADHLAGAGRGGGCGRRLHLVAHSMGGWALAHAVQAMAEIAAARGRAVPRLFDHAFLMAADVEAGALEPGGGLHPLLGLARRIHVYHAENDRALALSDVKPGHGARLGHLGPARMAALPDRVEAVDCAAVSWTPADGPLRHQYYRLAPEVIRDVRALLAGAASDAIPGRTSRADGRRHRLAHDPAARAALGAAG
jgi:esterase/lipase superfamily enzyme